MSTDEEYDSADEKVDLEKLSTTAQPEIRVWIADQLPSLLPVYYKRLFPYKHYVKWLHYGKPSSECFSHREFAFILKDDVHLRYRSYPDGAAFEKDLQAMCPYKVDIGAVFSASPRDNRKMPGFTPVERELVFDIDLTDYDDIRTCCKKATVCEKCWKFMVLAVRTMDNALSEDFAFQHRLWLFSGRRGVHCWVADDRAKSLPNNKRAQLADYLNVVVGSDKQKKRVTINPTATLPPPSMNKAYKLATGQIEGHPDIFKELCLEQGWLNDEECLPFLNLYTDAESREQLKSQLKKLSTPLARYQYLRYKFDPKGAAKMGLPADTVKDIEKSSFTPAAKSKWCMHEFVLQYSYARLDINVSKSMNHLLKSPFCVHPATGRIAVPINPKLVHKFKPADSPRLDELVEEAGEKMDEEAEGAENKNAVRKTLDYKRTSLAEYVDYFEEFVNKLSAARAANGKKSTRLTETKANTVDAADMRPHVLVKLEV